MTSYRITIEQLDRTGVAFRTFTHWAKDDAHLAEKQRRIDAAYKTDVTRVTVQALGEQQ